MSDILLTFPSPTSTSPQQIPALSIFYPGAALEREGHNVLYWDERWDNDRDLSDKIDKVDYVGTSSLTGEQLKGVKRILTIAKERGKTTIFGGIHASLTPFESIIEEYIDYIVVGEGEQTIVELIDAIDNGKEIGLGVVTKDGFKGFRQYMDGGTVESPITEKTLPYFEKSYPNDITLLTSRGCPYACTFRYNVVYNESKYRQLSLDKFEEDLDKLPGIEYIQFCDDWVGPKKRTIEIAKILHKRGIANQPQIRARDIDEEMADTLIEFGCTGLSLGIETGSPTVLKDIVNKSEKQEHFINAAKILASRGIKPQYYFIIGFPGESKEQRNETYDFADMLSEIHGGYMSVSFFSFTPYPGTPLFEKAKEEGIEVPNTLDGWSDFGDRSFYRENFTKEFANIYHIAGFTFHRGVGDKTDRNFPGWTRMLIKPFEMLCVLRWKLRFWGYYDLEKYFVEKLLRWAVYRNRRFQKELRISKAKQKADSKFGWKSEKKTGEGKYNIRNVGEDVWNSELRQSA